MARDSSTPRSKEEAPLGFRRHDHETCMSHSIDAALSRAETENFRLTPVRRKVLEILLQEHRAMGAYAVLDRLREAGFGSQPPVAYRALDFLVAHGLAHRIERLNAFVACAHPDESHVPAFMICRACSGVAEAPSSPAKSALNDAARAAGFQIECTVLEAEGLCPDCARSEPGQTET
jgi:Fur family zinc uptake transcriptional regulator